MTSPPPPVLAAGLLVTLCLAGCASERTAHVELVLQVALPDTAFPGDDQVVEATAAAIAARLRAAGARRPDVVLLDASRIQVRFSGSDAEAGRLTALAVTPGRLEIRAVDKGGRFESALPALDRALVRAGVTPAQLPEPGDPLETLLAPVDPAIDPRAARPLSTLLRRGRLPGEYVVPEPLVEPVDSLLKHPVASAAMPPLVELLWGAEVWSQAGRRFRPLYAVERQALITGEHVADAVAVRDSGSGRTLIRFHLTADGGEHFWQETSRHVGDHLAIVLDGLVRGGPPLLRDPIRRDGEIDMGDADLGDAQGVALMLRIGPLPARVRVITEGGAP